MISITINNDIDNKNIIIIINDNNNNNNPLPIKPIIYGIIISFITTVVIGKYTLNYYLYKNQKLYSTSQKLHSISNFFL
jgi:hypothetical protein